MPDSLGDAADRLSRSNSLRAQSAKFAVTGAIAAVVDLGLTWLFQIGFGVLGKNGARAVGFIIGTLVAYLLNRRWTFNAHPSKRRLVAVGLTYALTFAINMALYDLCFGLFDDRFGLNSSVSLVVAFAIAQGAATLANFFIQRWVIFRSTRKSFEVD